MMTVMAAIGGLGLALAPAPAAQSVADTTAPVLTTPVKASFTVGKQLELGSIPDCGDPNASYDVRVWLAMNFKWTAKDDSGAGLRYDLQEQTPNSDDFAFTDSTQTSFAGDLEGSNTDQSCGGGSWTIFEWDLTARDPAGNTTTNQIYGGRIRLTQDDNLADKRAYVNQATITYSRGWGLASCACWSGGGVHYTSTKNAAATITTTPTAGTGGGDGYGHAALVMHKGATRGKVQIYLNGVLNATVDLHSTQEQPRMVVWQSALPAFESATIKIVNLATKGHPRIDLDAVITN